LIVWINKLKVVSLSARANTIKKIAFGAGEARPLLSRQVAERLLSIMPSLHFEELSISTAYVH